MGPKPSMGSPKALITRPKKASDGAIVGAVGTSSARPPKPTPSTDPNGSACARPALNPTISAGTIPPFLSVNKHLSPMANADSTPPISTIIP